MIQISFNDNKEKYLNYIHFGFGIVIFIMAILALLKPNENMVLFPFIFLLSGFLYFSLFTIEFLFTKQRVTKRQYIQRILHIVFAIFLFIAFFISKTIIWS